MILRDHTVWNTHILPLNYVFTAGEQNFYNIDSTRINPFFASSATRIFTFCILQIFGLFYSSILDIFTICKNLKISCKSYIHNFEWRFTGFQNLLSPRYTYVRPARNINKTTCVYTENYIYIYICHKYPICYTRSSLH